MKTKVTRKSFLTFFWILFFGILIIVLCSSCSGSEHQSEFGDNSKNPQEDMFKVIYTNHVLKYHVVYDVETNVEYIVSRGQNNRGTFTMRVDSTGKPILYKY